MIAVFDNTGNVTDALRQWRSREVMTLDMSSAEIRGFSRELRMRSVLSARTTNAEYLDEIAVVVDDLLAGKTNMATARWRLLRKLKELGYDPSVGFPQDMANVPPAERGSLQDLSSQARLDLVLETNMRIAANYGRMVAGNTEYARHAYPAWELMRLYSRIVPRGSAESHSVGWARRWNDAGSAVGWVGAMEGRLIARKDSPIWQALGDGAGGHEDALGNPFPPFAFRSGMAWREVSRAECEDLGLGDGPAKKVVAPLSPAEATAVKWFKNLAPDLQEEIKRELANDSERERLRKAREEFKESEERNAAERRARLAETREAHRKFVEGLMAA